MTIKQSYESQVAVTFIYCPYVETMSCVIAGILINPSFKHNVCSINVYLTSNVKKKCLGRGNSRNHQTLHSQIQKNFIHVILRFFNFLYTLNMFLLGNLFAESTEYKTFYKYLISTDILYYVYIESIVCDFFF